MFRLDPTTSFIVGHNLGYVGSYFDQVLLASRLSLATDPKAKEHTTQMIANLQRVAPNFVQRLRFIETIAQKCGFVPRSLPALPDQYKEWAPKIHMDFMELWNIEDMEGWLFAHAYSIGELRNFLIVLLVSMDLQVNFSLNFKKELSVLLKNGKDTLQRYEETSLRLESSESYRIFYEQSLFHVPLIDQILQMKDPAIEFFASAQKLISSFAKVERDAQEWLKEG